MSIASLTLPAPIARRAPVAPRDYACRDRAIDLFDAQQYQDAVRQTLVYLLPGFEVPDLTLEALCLVQGSARVRARIEDGGLVLTTALAALTPDSQDTALLRFVLSRLSSTGQMFQPRLRENTITLEFRDRLSLLHPQKLIEVLQRLPMEAARNDAWLIAEFAVETPDREPIAPLEPEEFERALAVWHAHWSAIDELMRESRRRRSLRMLDALGSIAANQVFYALPLFGPLRARLNEYANDFTDKDAHPNKRDGALSKCLKEMRQVDAAALCPCLGHARYAINPLQEGTPSTLTSMLGSGQRMQATGEMRATGRALEAALELLADYLYLLAQHSWPIEVENSLRAGLDAASNMPWRDCADVLWNHANATVRAFGSHGESGRGDDAVSHYDDPRNLS